MKEDILVIRRTKTVPIFVGTPFRNPLPLVPEPTAFGSLSFHRGKLVIEIQAELTKLQQTMEFRAMQAGAPQEYMYRTGDSPVVIHITSL